MLGHRLRVSAVSMKGVQRSTHAGQPDGSRLDVKVHQIIDHAALQVILNPVDDDLAADVDELDVRQVLLILVDGLIDLLVVADAIAEVLRGHLGVLADVVRACGLDLEDVRHNEGFIVAFGFDKEGLDAFGDATALNPLAAGLGGVGGVQDGDDAVAAGEPAQHVSHRRLGRGTTKTFALGIGRVEELSRGLRGVGAPVGPDVEGPGLDGKPGQVPHHYGRPVSACRTGTGHQGPLTHLSARSSSCREPADQP